MDRTEKVGLGVATAGHVLLFAALSIGLLSTSKRVPPIHEPMEVMLTDEIGLRSAAPEISTETPATSEAPEVGPPAEAAPEPPEPTPAPPEPEPAPAPPAPAPKPTPKPAPAPKPTPKPAAKPAEPKPTPKPAPAKPAPAKPATKPAQGATEGTKPKATGSRLGKDFLKGIVDTPSPSKSTKPKVSAVSAEARMGFAAAVARQVKPCYELGSLGGTTAMSIVTVMHLRYNRDGTVAGTPEVVQQTGVDGGNRQYASQVADVAKRAVLRCSPIRLPAEIYEGGWEDFDMRFIPGQLG